jgi:PKD domain
MRRARLPIGVRTERFFQAIVPAVLLCVVFQGCSVLHKSPRPQPSPDEHLAVVIDADPTDGPAPLTVHFQADTFERTDIKEFHWDFADGSKSDRAAPTHTYTKPGDYTATVTAVSPTGLSDWSWESITAEGPDD